LVCLLLMLLALRTYADPASPVALVPQPARLVTTTGTFTLGPRTVISVTSQPGVAAIGEMLAQKLRTGTGYPVPVRKGRSESGPRQDAIVLTTLGADKTLGDEGYSLTASPDGVVICAPQAAGLFYGTQTLRQLLPPQIESPSPVYGVVWRVPGVQISDQPRFRVRGLMLDSARHLQSVGFIERTIDRMAYHRLNTFHWHLTDDTGWRIEIKRFPRLTTVGAWRDEGGHQYGGFYTQAQIRAIVAFAAARYVTIIPEIDMPAHSHAALAAYPALGCTPGPFRVLDIGQGTADVMDPGKPGTYDFVDGVFSEVMSLFPSPVIHIGGDECPKTQWKAAPECQALMRQHGLKDEDALQNYFTRHAATFLAAHGRRLQGWNEILQGGPLPSDVIVQQWNDPRAAAAAARAGNDVVVSLASHVYFDASNDATSLQKVYNFEPMPTGLDPAQSLHILGVEACLWTEGKPTDAVCDEFLWPRLTALAEIAWSPPETRDWAGFRARLLGTHYERLALMGLGTPGTDISPADVRQALIDRSDFDWGTRIGGWEPSQMLETWKTLDWDVTAQVHKPGMYTVLLNYEGGADALAIESVEIMKDGLSLAQDVHAGWTGGATRDRVYRLSLPAYEPAAHYAVRVHLRSDGGTDSHGAVWFLVPG
jgi:hexosaminidase